eukprot:Tbor_TRINITY_DN5767_c2_g1::TRINITY_DN5767_c2_g1_i2::g.20674::m.20674
MKDTVTRIKRKKNAVVYGPEDLREQETIAHVEICQKAPKPDYSLHLKNKYGENWYFSLFFLKWTLEVFGEYQLRDELNLGDIREHPNNNNSNDDEEIESILNLH